jgi:condensin complex subunit 2
MMLGEEEQPSIVVDDDDEDQEDDEAELSMSVKQSRRMSKQKKNRRRRRSSARFLKMGDISEENDENSSNSNHNETNIGEVYKNAIRMNAENRINASNSWNLSLIDHLDRFLTVPSNSSKVSMEDSVTPGATTVNFTKASCTLDASVKIYSYRVDDVHLTSYKVLANLNRTDGGNKKNQQPGDDATATMEGSESQGSQRQEKRRATSAAETLETNLCTF